jgi:hypothetical protein
MICARDDNSKGDVEGEKDKKTKGKGCDFGYALAANFCEEVASVDACTVTAF